MSEKFNFFNKIKSNKKIQYLLVILLSILLIIVVFSGVLTNKSTTEKVDETYAESLERRLEDVLSKVDGAGKVAVVINVESGMETVLAMKTTITESANGTQITETTPILVNGKTIVIKEMNPEITGVLIVCEGAKSISVMNKIQQATVSLLNINVNKIEILSMK